MNTSIQKTNRTKTAQDNRYRYRYQKVPLVTANEFWQFVGILLLARLEGAQGCGPLLDTGTHLCSVQFDHPEAAVKPE
jgi:hypothetical protein